MPTWVSSQRSAEPCPPRLDDLGLAPVVRQPGRRSRTRGSRSGSCGAAGRRADGPWGTRPARGVSWWPPTAACARDGGEGALERRPGDVVGDRRAAAGRPGPRTCPSSRRRANSPAADTCRYSEDSPNQMPWWVLYGVLSLRSARRGTGGRTWPPRTRRPAPSPAPRAGPAPTRRRRACAPSRTPWSCRPRDPRRSPAPRRDAGEAHRPSLTCRSGRRRVAPWRSARRSGHRLRARLAVAVSRRARRGAGSRAARRPRCRARPARPAPSRRDEELARDRVGLRDPGDRPGHAVRAAVVDSGGEQPRAVPAPAPARFDEQRADERSSAGSGSSGSRSSAGRERRRSRRATSCSSATSTWWRGPAAR